MEEIIFVGFVADDTTANTNPRDLLPVSVQALSVIHPSEKLDQLQPDYRHDDRVLNSLKALHKTDFPDQERIEIVCSVGFDT
jgi:hypothetical protein